MQAIFCAANGLHWAVVAMRLPYEKRPFGLIFPVRVTNQLALIPRQCADELRRALADVAQTAALLPNLNRPRPLDGKIRERGYALRYEIDHEHRAVIAVELGEEP
jgi:hypothetical protein